jgi:hypothetical protein
MQFPFSIKKKWLVFLAIGSLAIVGLLVARGCKQENNAAAPTANPSRLSTQPATAAAGTAAQQQSAQLVILPENPTSNDFLLAVFKGESGRVKYRWEKNGETLDGEELDRLAVKHLTKGAVITVYVDNAGASYSASVTIGNLPPVVAQVSLKNPAIHRGVDIELVASGEDPDGDDVAFNYKWFRDGSQINFSGGSTLSGDQFNRGDQISFQVIPFDGVEEGAPYEGTAITIPNAPPVFVSTPPLQFLSETYSYQAQAQDPDEDEVTYALENPPPGMIIDRKSGKINWALAGLPAGEYRINIVADDAQGQKGYQEYSLIMSRQ